MPPIHEWIRENTRRSIQEIYVATYATSAGTATGWQPLATSQGFGQYFTVPAGGLWLVWMHTINYNSTSSGGVGTYVVYGGTTLNAGNLQTKTPWWAIKLRN